MNTLTLSPTTKALYQLHTQNSHPRLTLRRVLYSKFLRWVDKATVRELRKAAVRSLLIAGITLSFVAPSFAVGFFLSLWRTAGPELSVFVTVVYLVVYWRHVLRLLRRRTRRGNQHTYHGVPSGELASYLIEHGGFKRDEAMKRLGLTQGQYGRITRELFDAGILYKGEQNAFTLRQIRLEDLVRQLREGFPLVWSEERQVWAERNGAFEEWCLSHDFKRRKLEEEIEKRERKKKRLEKQVSEYQGALASVFSPTTA